MASGPSPRGAWGFEEPERLPLQERLTPQQSICLQSAKSLWNNPF